MPYSSPALSDAVSPPSLTELVSPYVKMSPVPPKYSCRRNKASQQLCQRVVEFTKEALTNKVIDLENLLLNLKWS